MPVITPVQTFDFECHIGKPAKTTPCIEELAIVRIETEPVEIYTAIGTVDQRISPGARHGSDPSPEADIKAQTRTVTEQALHAALDQMRERQCRADKGRCGKVRQICKDRQGFTEPIGCRGCKQAEFKMQVRAKRGRADHAGRGVVDPVKTALGRLLEKLGRIDHLEVEPVACGGAQVEDGINGLGGDDPALKFAPQDLHPDIIVPGAQGFFSAFQQAERSCGGMTLRARFAGLHKQKLLIA